MAGLMEMLGMSRQPRMRGMMADTGSSGGAFPGMLRGNRVYISGDPDNETSWMSVDDFYAKRPFDDQGHVKPGMGGQPAPSGMSQFLNAHQMQPSGEGSGTSDFINSHPMQAEAAPMMGKLATPNADPEAATNPVMARLLRMKQQMQRPAPEPKRMAMSENFRDPRIMQPAMSRLGVANLTAPHWVDMGGGRMVRSDQLGQ